MPPGVRDCAPRIRVERGVRDGAPRVGGFFAPQEAGLLRRSAPRNDGITSPSLRATAGCEAIHMPNTAKILILDRFVAKFILSVANVLLAMTEGCQAGQSVG